MDKIEVITKHKSGDPKKDLSQITWVEFLIDMFPLDDSEVLELAVNLLSGKFLYGTNGYTYFLTGLNLRDKQEVKQ